jgi:hypothetical protein
VDNDEGGMTIANFVVLNRSIELYVVTKVNKMNKMDHLQFWPRLVRFGYETDV